MIKRLLSLMLALGLSCSLCIPASAYSVDSNDTPQDRYFICENGIFREVSEDEYLEYLSPIQRPIYNGKESHDNQILPADVSTTTYTLKNYYTSNGVERPVSAWAYYPLVPFVATSVTTTSTHTKTLSAVAKAAIRDKIETSLGFVVEESSSSSVGNAAGAFNSVPTPGYYSRILFTPLLITSIGTVTVKTAYNNGWNTNTYDVTSTYPISLSNGITNGAYHAEYSKTPY